MRKVLMFLVLVAAGLGTAAAQDTEVPGEKHSVMTNKFWANWFVSGGFDFNAAYSSQEKCPNKNPFSSDRGTFGFDVAVGKWFTPGIGLRTKFQGVWAKQVNTGNLHPSYKYWNLHEDVMFNLTNLLGGYDESRLWNFIPYVGLGVVRNMSRGGRAYNVSYNVGLLNNFRINNHLNVFLDIFALAAKGNMDGALNDGWNGYRRLEARHYDKIVGLSVGVTYNIGKSTWKKAPNVEALIAMNQEQMNALNAELESQREENERLQQMLDAKIPGGPEKTSVIEKIRIMPLSVFFDIGSSRIASRKDLVNVKELVEMVREEDRKIVVTGYADRKTGGEAYNRKLSEKRAQAIVEELVKMGITRERIVVETKGGVDTISPFSYNRRVTIHLQ